MTVTYVGNGPWGTGINQPLSVPQHDGNNHDHQSRIDGHETRIDAIETGGGSGIVSITQSEDLYTITITLTDSSEHVFPLPVGGWSDAGTWLNDKPLSPGAVFTVPDEAIYLTLIEHTTPSAPAVFNPAAVDEQNRPLYRLIATIPDLAGLLRDTGIFQTEFAYVRYDVFNNSLGTFVVEQDHVSDTTFDPLAESGGNPLYRQIAGPIFAPVSEVSGVDYTLQLSDAGQFLQFTNEAGCLITVPTHGAVAFPLNTEIHIDCQTSGPVIVDGDVGVIVSGIVGFENIGGASGAVMTLKKITTTTWRLFGYLLATSDTDVTA
jgi:hypothetical protein